MDDELFFIKTPYRGYEDEILLLRNINREIQRNRKYLDWRYVKQEMASPPEIFWVKTSAGNFVGMASLIYRPYWVGGLLREVMVLGDISLNKEYRGSGIAEKFLCFISEYIQEKSSACALVIPNRPAGKVLIRCGWRVQDQLVHHVLLLNPEKKIYSIVRIDFLSKALSACYRVLLGGYLMIFHAHNDCTLKISTEFDHDLDVFWKELQKDNQFTRDRSCNSLEWRYKNHPDRLSFVIVTFYAGKSVSGYLVYVVTAGRESVKVYELVSSDEKNFSIFIKLFVNYIQKKDTVDSIRIALNASHPLGRTLRKTGFSARKGGQLILNFGSGCANNQVENVQWCISSGDKDV
jgi:hypothetical protein